MDLREYCIRTDGLSFVKKEIRLIVSVLASLCYRMLEMHPKSVQGRQPNILSVGLVYLPEHRCAGGVEYSVMLVNQSKFEESIIKSR